ncbi:MAG: S1 family peptidase [Acidobacteriota bacterium]
MYRPRISLLFGLTALLLVSFVGSALAQDSKPLSPEEALLQDAEAYALHFDVPLEDAIRRLERQPAIGDLAAELYQDSTFAGLWIDHSPRFQVTARFTSPEAGLRRIESLKDRLRGVPVRILGAPRSLRDLEAEQTQAAFVLERARVASLVDLDIDVRNNRVVASVVDALELAFAVERSSFRLPAALHVEEVAAVAGDFAQVYAGLNLTTCTMGFSVRDAGGATGVLTAGHCGNTQSHGGRNLPFQGECFSGSEDVQWHDDTVHHFPLPWMKAGSGSRTVNSTRTRTAQAIGTWVCKHGKTTGFTCASITSISFRPNTSIQPGANATFVRVSGSGTLASGGDSGAPYYAGNEAYGVLKGGISGDSTCRSTLSTAWAST